MSFLPTLMTLDDTFLGTSCLGVTFTKAIEALLLRTFSRFVPLLPAELARNGPGYLGSLAVFRLVTVVSTSAAFVLLRVLESEIFSIGKRDVGFIETIDVDANYAASLSVETTQFSEVV